MKRRSKLLAGAVAVLLAGALAACTPSAAAPPDLSELEQPTAAPAVATLGILGDSVSLGVNACAEQDGHEFGPCGHHLVGEPQRVLDVAAVLRRVDHAGLDSGCRGQALRDRAHRGV